MGKLNKGEKKILYMLKLNSNLSRIIFRYISTCIFLFSIKVALHAAEGNSLQVSIDPNSTFQTMEFFAASDAWSGNFVGQYFDEQQKEDLSRWLFSNKLGADGNPEGIGLSQWRINLGGGTLEQDGADIIPFQNRSESYLTKDGRNFDWGKCSGQQYFMKKAKEYGVDNFLLFSNTPPVQYTKNGLGYAKGTKDFSANLKDDCYGKFADYLAGVAKHFVDAGYNIRYISPINEPQWRWDYNKQEGSPWYLENIYKMHKELDRALEEKNLDSVNAYLGEAANLESLYGRKPPSYKGHHHEFVPLQSRPEEIIKNFFDKDSKYYVGNFKHIKRIVAGHSYHSDFNKQVITSVREKLAEECSKYGVQYQQSEWCMLSFATKKHDVLTKDWHSDNYADIQISLAMCRLIYADIVIGGSNAWGYWKAMEINGNNALTGVYPKDGDITKGGVARPNKLLWALGNYSFFIRPGYKRVALVGADDIDKVAASAYISPDGKRIVAVFVNSSFNEYSANIALPKSFKDKLKNISAFRTDSASDLANLRLSDKDSTTIVPRSITTLVWDLE